MLHRNRLIVRSLIRTFAVVACAAVLGCGGSGVSIVKVDGSLTLDGAPYGPVSLVVSNENPKGPSAVGAADDEGNVTFGTNRPDDGGLPVGKFRVKVIANPGNPPSKPVPAQYGSSSNSGLSFEVKDQADHPTIRLEMTSGGSSGAAMAIGGGTRNNIPAGATLNSDAAFPGTN